MSMNPSLFRNTARFLLILVFLAFCVSGNAVAAVSLPASKGYVTDPLGVLDRQYQGYLHVLGDSLGSDHGVELAIFVVDAAVKLSLDPLAGHLNPPERGLALVLSLPERSVVFHVGDGLKEELSEAALQSVVHEVMRTPLSVGDYGDALILGVQAVRDKLRPQADPGRDGWTRFGLLLLGTAVLLGIQARRRPVETRTMADNPYRR